MHDEIPEMREPHTSLSSLFFSLPIPPIPSFPIPSYPILSIIPTPPFLHLIFSLNISIYLIQSNQPTTVHCFEYLRQVLQCHGDVGIMSLGWDAEGEAYTAIFETKRQCRNFEMIREWTREHQVLTFLPTNELHAEDFGEGEGKGE